jgi:hypothetical protein
MGLPKQNEATRMRAMGVQKAELRVETGRRMWGSPMCQPFSRDQGGTAEQKETYERGLPKSCVQ